jgi:ankyrin repeat protein
MMYRWLIFMVLTGMFLAAPAYGQTSDQARRELQDSNIYYSSDSFFTAVRNGDYRAVKLFLLSGMDPNIKDDNDMTPLMYAAQNGDRLIAETLLQGGADVDVVQDGPFGKNALVYAAEYQKPEMVKFLLNYGAYPDVQDKHGMTPLMYAARKGNPQIVKYLILSGSDVNIQAEDGRTALIFAAQEGNSDIVRALLAAGADRNLVAENGTARDYAQRARYFEVIHILDKASVN